MVAGTAIASATTLDDARSLHRSGALNDALVAYQAVLDGDSSDADRAVAHNNACVIYTDRGSYAQAETHCREALTLRRALADGRGVARTLNNLARLLQATDRRAAARMAHEESLQTNLERDDRPAQIVNRINLAALDAESQRPAAALANLAAAEQLLDDVDPEWARGQRALIALNRAVVLERIGAFREALEHIDSALAAATEAAPHLLADAHLNRGVILRNLGDPAAALSAYRLARSAFVQRGERPAAFNAALNEAIVLWRDRGDAQAAREALETLLLNADSGSTDDRMRAHYLAARLALDAGELDLARRAVDAVGAIDPRAVLAHDAMARLQHFAGNLDDAIASAQAAIAAIERSRQSMDQARYRQSLLTEQRGSYELAIDYLHQRYLAHDQRDDLDAALDLSARAKALGLIDSLSDRRGAFVIGSGQQYVETFFSAQRLHVWHLTDSEVRWRTLDAGVVRAAAARVRADVMRDRSPPADALAVLNDLIAPVTQNELVLGLDGLLAETPFDAILTVGGQGPVIRHAAAIALDGGERPRVRAPRAPGLVALAQGDVQPGNLQHPALRGLRSLDNLDNELAGISEFFPDNSTILTGGNATASAYLARPPADVQHIASHAVFDSTLNNGAVLVLGADDASDGLLFPRDIARQKRPARLTVLSACSTARSSGTAGAPVNHLAGAFLASGSRAVIASLWDVDDAATAAIMQQFYARLATGLLPHEALHATKAALRTRPGWDRPSLWAAWIVYGPSDQPVFPAPRWRAPPWYSLGLVLLAAGVWWLVRRPLLTR